MRLAIVSDTHLGFARGTVREGDAYLALKQAFEGIAQQGVDAIIHPGDFFDHKIPTQEVWNEAFDLLTILQRGKNPGVKITHSKRGGTAAPFNYLGIPLIAIAGTHEYRSKDLMVELELGFERRPKFRPTNRLNRHQNLHCLLVFLFRCNP